MWPTLTTTPHSLSLSLSLSPSVGTNEAQSLQNFKEWLDYFALLYCRRQYLVKDLDGNRVHGLFHHKKKGECDDFESHLSDLMGVGITVPNCKRQCREILRCVTEWLWPDPVHRALILSALASSILFVSISYFLYLGCPPLSTPNSCRNFTVWT